MSQQVFQDRHQQEWTEVTDLLEGLDGKGSEIGIDEFPSRYRKVCQQLSLARYRRYSADLVEGLNRVALRGHQHLYTRRAPVLKKMGSFVAAEFPQLVRKEWRLLLLSCLLFFGTGLASYAAIKVQPEMAYTIIGPSMASNLETMYDPDSEHFLRERPSDSDLLMFGFYIRNNIGIGFRTYSSGVLLGIGSAFFMFFNGLLLGGAAGHIDNMGFGSTFYTFVIGHGAFELTAIMLAGLAGMRLGVTIVAPGRRSRHRALIEEGKKSVKIVYGFAGMLLIAAFLEAFWSSSSMIPPTVKLTVGAILWALVIGYFAFAGRGRGAR